MISLGFQRQSHIGRSIKMFVRRAHPGNQGPKAQRQKMLERIRRDYKIHGRSCMDRAFWAMAVFRFGQWTLRRRFGPWRWCVSKVYGCLRLCVEIVTNVTIDAHMQVGEDLHLIHAEGPISIHPDTVIGDRCGIMHNVTIGTNMTPGAPAIGDDVFIGVGACVLGDITVGDRVRISANSLVINDVPDDAIVIGVPAKPLPRLAPLASARSASRE